MSVAEMNKITSLDGLESVISAFNEATERLQRSHAALEERVVELTAELERKNVELERSRRLAAIGEMAAAVVHDVRHPIAVIAADIAMLSREDCSERARSLVARMKASIADLESMTERMMDLARDLRLRTTSCDLRDLLEETLALAEIAIDEVGVEVVRRWSDEPVSLVADPVVLQKALLNIVLNATEAMKAVEAGTRRLTVECAPEGDLVRATFRDTGPGLPPAIAETVFEPFVSGREGGTGLGLAIVQRFVAAHGGTVAATNGENGGAVFAVVLPRGAAT